MTVGERGGRLATPAGQISIAFDGPSGGSSALVLAHGAGGGMAGDFMVAFASGLAAAGHVVCRFNFPYMEAGKKSPDRTDVLESAFREVTAEVRRRHPQARLVIGGKSMGGRIASHLAAQGDDVDGLVFLGYPLHPPGRPDRARVAHLADIRAPMLFVEGTRDPFCPLDALRDAVAGLRAPTEIAVIDDGDHSLKVRKSSGRTTKQAWGEAVAAVLRWLDSRAA
jgi:predicted alpha/beta-hydrolase family hydrolase